MMNGMVEKIKSVVDKSKVPHHLVDEFYFWRSYDKRKIEGFKNIHNGKRCFIIGNGPSLNAIDLTKLKNEYTFGVNSIFLKQDELVPTYYVVEDYHVAHDNAGDITSFTGPVKFIPRNYKQWIKPKGDTVFYNMNTGYYQEFSPSYKIPRFSKDFSNRAYCGQSVTMICLQLAFYMGFDSVYLVGMDFNYEIPTSAVIEPGGVILSTEDDPNHFDPTYFGKGKRWHDPHLDRVGRSYHFIKGVYEAHDKEIINATVGGKLEIFEREDFANLF